MLRYEIKDGVIYFYYNDKIVTEQRNDPRTREEFKNDKHVAEVAEYLMNIMRESYSALPEAVAAVSEKIQQSKLAEPMSLETYDQIIYTNTGEPEPNGVDLTLDDWQDMLEQAKGAELGQMELKINVVNQSISFGKISDKDKIVADSVNYLKFIFSFSNEWTDDNKYALFYNPDETNVPPVQIRLTKDSETSEFYCMVPPQVIKFPRFELSVYTVSGTQLITSETLTVPVKRSGYRSNGMSPGPTPPLSIQIYTPADNETKLPHLRQNNGLLEWSADGNIWAKIEALPGPQGEQGLSAYQVWLNAGNTGTEQDFFNSLKGNTGAPGVNIDIRTGFISMYVDENGDLWLLTAEGADNPFEYDEETGNLYYVMKEAS